MTVLRCFFAVLFTFLTPAAASAAGLWDRDNLFAWCIVPFDAAKRTPAQRAEMLVQLGLQSVAYDWRDQHVAEFEEEFLQYQNHGIRMVAFWGIHPKALELFVKHDLHPQIWIMALAPEAPTEAERVQKAAAELLPAVEQAREAKCQIALYNHGGWAGEPETMAAIVKELREKHGAAHAGIVYNFHHGHSHIADFAAKWKAMQPYLLAVNLNGMDPGGDSRGRKILHLSEGSQELEMMRIIGQSGWSGPVGLIDHREETDSAITLRNNLRGFDWLVKELATPGSGGPKPSMDDGSIPAAKQPTGKAGE